MNYTQISTYKQVGNLLLSNHSELQKPLEITTPPIIAVIK